MSRTLTIQSLKPTVKFEFVKHVMIEVASFTESMYLSTRVTKLNKNSNKCTINFRILFIEYNFQHNRLNFGAMLKNIIDSLKHMFGSSLQFTWPKEVTSSL